MASLKRTTCMTLSFVSGTASIHLRVTLARSARYSATSSMSEKRPTARAIPCSRAALDWPWSSGAWPFALSISCCRVCSVSMSAAMKRSIRSASLRSSRMLIADPAVSDRAKFSQSCRIASRLSRMKRAIRMKPSDSSR